MTAIRRRGTAAEYLVGVAPDYLARSLRSPSDRDELVRSYHSRLGGLAAFVRIPR